MQKVKGSIVSNFPSPQCRTNGGLCDCCPLNAGCSAGPTGKAISALGHEGFPYYLSKLLGLHLSQTQQM